MSLLWWGGDTSPSLCLTPSAAYIRIQATPLQGQPAADYWEGLGLGQAEDKQRHWEHTLIDGDSYWTVLRSSFATASSVAETAAIRLLDESPMEVLSGTDCQTD